MCFLVSCARNISEEEVERYPDTDSIWLTATGKGSTPRLAIGKAWRNAMEQYLIDTINDGFKQESRIRKFVIKNWRKYTVGAPENARILRRYNKREIYIEVHIEGALLRRHFLQ